MEPLRILHIVHTLNRGGMESRIMDLYRNLDHDRFQFDFYVESGNSGMFDEEVRNLGGRVFFSQKQSHHNLPNFKDFYRFLIKHPEYRIVYAYNQWAGLYLKQAKKCRILYRVANARTSIQTKSIKNNIKNLVKMNVNKYATHRFAVSRRASEWLFGKVKTRSGEVNIWPNAIDTKKFAFSEEIRQEVRCELGLDNEFTVMHVGNIRFEKNHLFLLKVFAELKNLRSDAKLVLVGGGDTGYLKLPIKKLGIEDAVIYLGVRTDIDRLLQAGDVFVFPSLYEGFPGAVLEAEASGLNCLISDSITEEVMLTDHIVALPLSEHPKTWAQKVLEFGEVDRFKSWKEIKSAGYDIEDLTIRTQEFFEMLDD